MHLAVLPHVPVMSGVAKSIPLGRPNVGAPCSAGGSIVKALTRASQVLSREFSLTSTFTVSSDTVGCRQVKRLWGEWAAVHKLHGRREKKMKMALRSCQRFFDVRCGLCDGDAAREARDLWASNSLDCNDEAIPQSRIELLKTHVRTLVGGWGKRLRGCRSDDRSPQLPSDVYVPDQQGCREVRRGEGGTLACSASYDGDAGLVRRGVAKTKGKFRVVTMQSAHVKRVLRPVHNALYDHLSSFHWLVRGDVSVEDFCAVLDSGDEQLISGDYRSATDNIDQRAVSAIVEVLAECGDLEEEEAVVLQESFRNLRWESSSGLQHPIRKGSMMGNLVSFPLLCLLNKACHDIAADRVYGEGKRRIGRFNGDDCLFQGNDAMFSEWRLVTSWFGLIVNEEKTLISRRWADLNSQTFDVIKRRLIPKPVLSFLQPNRDSPGEILSSVLSGVSSFRPSVRLWVVNVLMRYEISLRGFSLSNIPSGWCRVLMKKKWFRNVVWSDPTPERVAVQCASSKPMTRPRLLICDRSFPCVVGPPPRPQFLSLVERLCGDVSLLHTENWSGIKVIPAERKLDRKAFRSWYDAPRPPLPRTRFLGVSVRWGFLWPTCLYEAVESIRGFLLSDDESLIWKTYPSSSLLLLRYSYRCSRQRLLYPPPDPDRPLGFFPRSVYRLLDNSAQGA